VIRRAASVVVAPTASHTLPWPSQKRANAHSASASARSIVGPSVTTACSSCAVRLAVSVPSNPTLACVSSQNGLVDDRPHRQRRSFARVGTVAPCFQVQLAPSSSVAITW
jgi:hypothetical protein